MRIILDTNVILSAFLTQGMSCRVLERCTEEHDLYISSWILKEVEEKLEKKFKIRQIDKNEALEFLKSAFWVIQPKGKLPNKSRDKDDNNLLLLADYVSAIALITGDKDLLTLKKYKKTAILPPRDFYQKYLLR